MPTCDPRTNKLKIYELFRGSAQLGTCFVIQNPMEWMVGLSVYPYREMVPFICSTCRSFAERGWHYWGLNPAWPKLQYWVLHWHCLKKANQGRNVAMQLKLELKQVEVTMKVVSGVVQLLRAAAVLGKYRIKHNWCHVGVRIWKAKAYSEHLVLSQAHYEDGCHVLKWSSFPGRKVPESVWMFGNIGFAVDPDFDRLNDRRDTSCFNNIGMFLREIMLWLNYVATENWVHVIQTVYHMQEYIGQMEESRWRWMSYSLDIRQSVLEKVEVPVARKTCRNMIHLVIIRDARMK